MGMPIINASNTTKIQALTDILVSISLEEAAIAHILNAEGLKIQRIVRDSESTTEEILCVNKSVDNIADTLTNLVMLLKSKMRLVLNDKCYTNFCDDPCALFRFRLTSTNGTITPTPFTPNHYNLVVNAGANVATVIITTIPATNVTLSNVQGTGVIAQYAGSIITITPDPNFEDFEGTVTATLTLPNGCTRNITIHVTQAPVIPCDEYRLDLDANNGTLTPNINDSYTLFVPNPDFTPTIEVNTIPNSTVTLSDINVPPDSTIAVGVINNMLIISSETFDFNGIISATVNFAGICSRSIVINVTSTPIPPICGAVSLTATAGAGGTVSTLGGTNHFQWTLLREAGGDTLTIGTNTLGVNITNIEITLDTVIDLPDVNVTTTAIAPFTITITKPLNEDIASGVIKLRITYGNGCTTIMQLNVQAPN